MAQYPGSTPTNQNLYISVNNAQTFLTAGIDAVVTTIPISDTSSFSADGIIGIGTEAIHYTSKDATNFLGCTRAFDSTTATTHALNAVVKNTVVAIHHNSIKDEIIAIATDLRAVFTGDLDDAVTPVAVATSIKNRLDHIATALSNITGVDWKTAPNDDINSIDGRVTTNTNDISNNADEIINCKTNLKNILVNGGQEIWQRATSFTNPVTNTNVSDKWEFLKSGSVAPTVNITRSTSVDTTGKYSLQFDITVAGSGSPRCSIRQLIENFEQYKGRTISFHARIKSDGAGPKITIQDGVGNAFSSAHTGGGAWETLTVTRIIDNGASGITLAIGYVDTDVTANDIWVDNLMVTISDVAIAYVPEDSHIELSKCHRYYQKEDNWTVSTLPIARMQGDTPAPSITRVDTEVRLPVEMSATPSITITKGTTYTLRGNPLHTAATSLDVANWNTFNASAITTKRFSIVRVRDTDIATHPILQIAGEDWEAEV